MECEGSGYHNSNKTKEAIGRVRTYDLQVIGYVAAAADAVCDDEHWLADPFVVEVINSILESTRDAVVVFCGDDDVCIKSFHCIAPNITVNT